MTSNKHGQPDIDLPIAGAEEARHEAALLWYMRVCFNIQFELYASKRNEWWQHHILFVKHLGGFRRALRDRGWKVPSDEQEKFVAKVVASCKKSLSVSKDTHFIPAYFRKALIRAMNYYAEELSQHKTLFGGLTEKEIRELWTNAVNKTV